MGASRVDLFSYILGDNDSDEKSRTSKASGDLVCDSELAIVAGSETTAITLTAVLYLLALYPEKKKLLQEEVDGLLSSADDLRHQKLAGKPILDGCIQEAMRLYPAVPSGTQRLTPPEGAMIAGRWIPGDTLVSTPTFSLHRGKLQFQPPFSSPPNPFPFPILARRKTYNSRSPIFCRTKCIHSGKMVYRATHDPSKGCI